MMNDEATSARYTKRREKAEERTRVRKKESVPAGNDVIGHLAAAERRLGQKHVPRHTKVRAAAAVAHWSPRSCCVAGEGRLLSALLPLLPPLSLIPVPPLLARAGQSALQSAAATATATTIAVLAAVGSEQRGR